MNKSANYEINFIEETIIVTKRFYKAASPSAFNQRMKTGKFSSEDLASIAAALQATFFFGFEFEDGTKI